jgi:hypothetical protein
MVALKVRAGYESALSQCYKQLEHLPVYARPIFLRILQSGWRLCITLGLLYLCCCHTYHVRMLVDMDVTGTFKHRKVQLVREVFDVTTLPDSIYIRDDTDKTYSPWTPVVYHKLLSGSLRL